MSQLLATLTKALHRRTHALHSQTCEFAEVGGPCGDVVWEWQDSLIAVEKALGLYGDGNWMRIATEGLPPRVARGRDYISRPLLVTVAHSGPGEPEWRTVTEAFYRFDTKTWINAGSGRVLEGVIAWMFPPSPMEDEC